MTMIARRDFLHNGVNYETGAEVDLDEAQLKALACAGLVELTEQDPGSGTDPGAEVNPGTGTGEPANAEKQDRNPGEGTEGKGNGVEDPESEQPDAEPKPRGGRGANS